MANPCCDRHDVGGATSLDRVVRKMNSPYRHETLFVEECAAYYLIAGRWFAKKGDDSMGFYLGTDVGGTFTDLWVAQSGGRMRVFKSPTTPDVMSGVIHAMHLATEHFELSFEDFCAQIERFGHGTTVGLNALLTGSASPTLVVTTQGFGDTLEIGRMRRQTAGLSDRARPLLSQFALLKEQLGETSGQVAVGIPPSWQEVFTSDLIRRIMSDTPRVTLRIHEGVSHVLREHMIAGLLDLCIVPFSITPLSGYTQTNLVREPLVLMGHKSAKLDANEPIALNKLNDIKLVLPGKPNTIRQLIEHSLQRQSLKFKLAMQVDTLALCMNVASQNLAYTVVPSCAVVGLKGDHDISWSPIKGLFMTWALFENVSRIHSPAAMECQGRCYYQVPIC